MEEVIEVSDSEPVKVSRPENQSNLVNKNGNDSDSSYNSQLADENAAEDKKHGDGQTCTICCKYFDDKCSVLSCGHIYHDKCIQTGLLNRGERNIQSEEQRWPGEEYLLNCS